MIGNLGDEYARGRYRWDDAFLALAIFDEFVTDSSEALTKIRSQLRALVGRKEIFWLKTNGWNRIFWHVRNAVLVMGVALKLGFYKCCQVVSSKKKYAKKIKKSNDRLKMLRRVVV